MPQRTYPKIAQLNKFQLLQMAANLPDAHFDARDGSPAVNNGSVSTDRLSASAFSLLKRPTPVVGGTALITVPSNLPNQLSDVLSTVPAIVSEVSAPAESTRNSHILEFPVIPQVEIDSNDRDSSISNDSQAFVDASGELSAGPREADGVRTPVRHSHITHAHSILDPISKIGTSFPLGQNVYTLEGFTERCKEYTILVGRDLHTGHKMCLKVICKYEYYQDHDLYRDKRGQLYNEGTVMRTAYNKNLPGLVRSPASWSDDHFIYHWMDYPICTLGDAILTLPLHDFVFNRYVTELLLALTILHDEHYVHRAIGTGSIYMQADGSLAIGHFVEIHQDDKVVPDSVTGRAGFEGFMAPEMIAPGIFGSGKQGYSHPVDVWSLGVVFLHMYSRTPRSPFGDTVDKIEYTSIARDARQLPIMRQIYNHDRLLHDLLCQMLVRNPAQRATARQLLAHPYIEHMQVDLNNLDNSFPKSGRVQTTPTYSLQEAEVIPRTISEDAAKCLLFEEGERKRAGDIWARPICS
ncbi:hypothetical protein EIP86_005863 [Pleurotus ostreatoroseus]|nr:hypothetical protein EIP86_005863 [Pleurotus ostreatoroseus]